MKEKSPTSENATDSLGDNRLEAVRDLLFGQNDQAYREEFREIRNKLAENKKELENKSEALESDLINRLEKLEKLVEKRIETTESKILQEINSLQQEKMDRKRLATMLQNMAKELES